MIGGALYHRLKTKYKPVALLAYIEGCVEELNLDFQVANIVLAGDINQLPNQDLVERMGLMHIVHQPTHGANILDRIYVSSLQLCSTVQVVASTAKSDQKAVVAFQEGNRCAQPKSKIQRTFGPETPVLHAQFLPT